MAKKSPRNCLNLLPRWGRESRTIPEFGKVMMILMLTMAIVLELFPTGMAYQHRRGGYGPPQLTVGNNETIVTGTTATEIQECLPDDEAKAKDIMVVYNVTTFTYEPLSEQGGMIYLTYREPDWTDKTLAAHQVIDTRDLASAPFVASFLVPITIGRMYIPNLDGCEFITPLTYLRDDAITARLIPDPIPTMASEVAQFMDLQFTQSGTYRCLALARVTNVEAISGLSLRGTIAVRTFRCANGKRTTGTTASILQTWTPIDLPAIFYHRPCSRLTLTFDSESQLTLRQTNGLALDIDAHETMEAEDGHTTQSTVLMAYTMKQMSPNAYKSVLSFCTFGGHINIDKFNPNSLQLPRKGGAKVQASVKSSKVPSYCSNGVKDFHESDIDCGGAFERNGCPPCVDESQICIEHSDCVSGECLPHNITGMRCRVISGTNWMVQYSVGIIVAVAMLW